MQLCFASNVKFTTTTTTATTTLLILHGRKVKCAKRIFIKYDVMASFCSRDERERDPVEKSRRQ